MEQGLGLTTAPPDTGLGISIPTTGLGLDATQPIDQAHQALQMTPQERGLYERHLANLNGPGKIMQPDGSISTLLQMNVQGPDGMHYNIPSVYNGRALDFPEAIRNADQQGWHNFPSYPTPQAAEARYQLMHSYMDKDVQNYLKKQKTR